MYPAVKKLCLGISVVCMLLTISTFSVAFSQDIIVPGEILVKFKSGVSPEQIDNLNSLFGVSTVDLPKVDDIRLLKFPEHKSVWEMVDIYSQNPSVEFAVPRRIVRVTATPNDPNRTSQWALNKISAYNAWDVNVGSSSVRIGIIDTGVDWDHPDLSANIWINLNDPIDGQDNDNNGLVDDYRGYDWVEVPQGSVWPGEDWGTPDNNPMDFQGHGTHVAGIAAARTNNSTGIAGLAGGWHPSIAGCRIMALRAGYKGYDGYGYIDILAARYAIYYAARNGAKVINMSWGSYSLLPDIKVALDTAYARGCVLVASSGNNNTTSMLYPAAYNDIVIAVGATDEGDQRCDPGDWGTNPDRGSNYGSWLDVAAPGNNIPSTYYDNTYIYNNGTSMAAPHVAGLAALIFSKTPSFSNAQVRKRIEHTAQQVGGYTYSPTTGKSSELGHGRINANDALRYYFVPSTEYPTIASALNEAVSGYTVVVAAGSHTVSTNLTVASGVILDIKPGATLNFTGNYKLRVEGTFTANGTYSNKITFTNSGGTWYGIEFYNASYLSQISYSIIQNAQYGVRIINSSPSLSWNSIKLNTVGVQFENNSYDYATTLQGNMIEENVDGVKCYQYSDPAINPSNVIRYNNFYGVYGDATAVPSMGFYYPTGYNSIYYNTFEVWSAYPGTIYARYHWWGDPNPTPNVSGNVDWSNYLDYDPNSGMGKAVAKEVASENPSNQTASGAAADTVGMVEVDQAYKVFLEGNGEQALALFEGLVGKYPDHLAGRRALAFVSRCLYKLNRRNEAVARMNQLVQNHAGKEVFGLAQSIATGELVKNGQYAEAIATSQAILNDFPKTTLAKYALYDLGSIYWYRLADEKTGEAYYRQLIADWPDDDLTISALATLGEWNPKPDKGSAPALANTQNVPAKYALSQNFPNPFNPQTMIQYELPEASHITVKIYNLFGQEVRTLVAGHRETGYHTEIWDGRDDFGRRVASGVYFYRLSAEPNATQSNGFQFTRKMVLTQ